MSKFNNFLDHNAKKNGGALTLSSSLRNNNMQSKGHDRSIFNYMPCIHKDSVLNLDPFGEKYKLSHIEGLQIPIAYEMETNKTVFYTVSDIYPEFQYYHGYLQGRTSSGKTMILHNLIINGSTLYSPEQLEFILMDLKERGSNFAFYKDLANVRSIICNDKSPSFFSHLFSHIQEEYTNRMKEIGSYLDIGSYLQAGGKMSRIIVVCDEANLLFNSSNYFFKGCMNSLEQFLRQTRAAGIYFMFSAQDGSFNNDTMKRQMAIKINGAGSSGMNLNKESEQLLSKEFLITFEGFNSVKVKSFFRENIEQLVNNIKYKQKQHGYIRLPYQYKFNEQIEFEGIEEVLSPKEYGRLYFGLHLFENRNMFLQILRNKLYGNNSLILGDKNKCLIPMFINLVIQALYFNNCSVIIVDLYDDSKELLYNNGVSEDKQPLILSEKKDIEALKNLDDENPINEYIGEKHLIVFQFGAHSLYGSVTINHENFSHIIFAERAPEIHNVLSNIIVMPSTHHNKKNLGKLSDFIEFDDDSDEFLRGYCKLINNKSNNNIEEFVQYK